MSADLLCRGEVSPRAGGLESFGPGGEEPREAKRQRLFRASL